MPFFLKFLLNTNNVLQPVIRTCEFCILLFSRSSPVRVEACEVPSLSCCVPTTSALKQEVIFAVSRHNGRVAWLQAVILHLLSPHNG